MDYQEYVNRKWILTMLANDPVELNNAINTFLLNLNILLYCSFSLNIYEY